MTWYTSFDPNADFGNVTLDGDDGFFVPQYLSLAANNKGGGVFAAGLNNKVIVAGSLASTDHYAILLAGKGLFDGNPSGSSVRVEDTGQVRGLGAIAISLAGQQEHLNNAGLVAAEDGIAVQIASLGNAGGSSDITNTGRIISNGDDAVSRDASSMETVVTHNSGLIQAGENRFAYYAGTDGDAVDLVYNTGKMVGAIALGRGNDLYDGRKGSFSGPFVNGGLGNDKIYGGSEASTIIGGDGNDKLLGGLGDDSFEFEHALNASTNVDHILDFHNAKGDNDRFLLYSVDFAGLAAGKTLAAGAFQDIAKHAEEADDRILYDSGSGKLFFDHDGKGGDGAVKFAVLDNHASLTAADFFVV